APKRSAPRPLRRMSCDAPTPTAIRHEASTAVIATISEPPKSSVTMPVGVVRKNIAISVSATTRWDVRARSQYRSNVVPGMSNANAIALYARSVIERTLQERRKSPSAPRNMSRAERHILDPLVGERVALSLKKTHGPAPDIVLL